MSYYKIISPLIFEEIKVLGDKKTLHVFEAKILPDRNYIYDLIYNYEKYWIESTQEEYESIKVQSSSID
jgi:hypothetical protein